MDGESLDIKQLRLQRMKELFPEVFTEEEVDWEKLKAAFGEDVNFANERYVLNWAGKSDAFRVLQQPTTATLKPIPEESVLTTPLIPLLDKEGSLKSGGVDFISSPIQNLFIEGENLEVLKALQKAYYGKVKCIIIDPPYNTGSDSFIYPDKFSEKKEDYLKRIGDKDEEGFLMKEGLFRKNSKDSGHYHSNWLSMMYPRLFLAKNLLRDDGVIFVHIDDNEVHNLRMVMNEIFGEENFVDTICWKKKYGGGAKEKYLVSVHEYILLYSKTKIDLPEILVEFEEEKARRFYKYKDDKFETRGYYRTHPLEAVKSFDIRDNLRFPVVAPDGLEVYPKRQWRWSKERFEEALSKDEVIFSKNKDGEWVLYSKQYLNEENGVQRKTKAQSLIDDIFTQEGTKEVVDIFGDAKIFPFPKPNRLIKKLLEISGLCSNDIILDFFAGSGTTAQAVLELNKEDGGNRKFILVQMPEPCDENSEAYKAGYKTIDDIGKERIRRVIGKIDKEVIVSEAKQSQGNLLAATEIASSQTPRNDTKPDLGFKVFKLSSSSFKIWRGVDIDSEEKLAEQLDVFTNPIKPGAEKQNMLYELMLKAGYELTSSIQHVIASGAKQSQKGKKIASGSSNHRNDSIGFYSINNNELIIALDAMSETLVEQIITAKPQKVITLDSLFTGNDQLKTNTVLQMRDAGVDFKTI